MLAASPMGNREVTSVASSLISGMKLGTHADGTDVLNIAYTLKPYDYTKSPETRAELMDAYLRLDRNLEQLFNEIDRSVGLDKTVLFLAATANYAQGAMTSAGVFLTANFRPVRPYRCSICILWPYMATATT